jgi:hypothetical protein
MLLNYVVVDQGKNVQESVSVAQMDINASSSRTQGQASTLEHLLI